MIIYCLELHKISKLALSMLMGMTMQILKLINIEHKYSNVSYK